ncbi:MAG: non-heme iron oxygenase ferredoxin subunit [Acidimicrobiia bacterium]|nr:non-heme iron oxygenase ferredoxin subunit [Acidimicrobiia bacterium]
MPDQNSGGNAGEIRVCGVDDVEPGSALRVDTDGLRLAVVRIGDDWYVVGDECSHENYSLSEGFVDEDDCVIECPKHGSAFDLTTGDAKTLPATRPVPTYAVRVDGADVLVRREPRP